MIATIDEKLRDKTHEKIKLINRVDFCNLSSIFICSSIDIQIKNMRDETINKTNEGIIKELNLNAPSIEPAIRRVSTNFFFSAKLKPSKLLRNFFVFHTKN